MNPIIKIKRIEQDENQTLGQCSVFIDGRFLFNSCSLERGWRNNQQNVSCIPLGEYKVVLEYSPRFKKDLWEIKGVENRSECKFHSSNYWRQLNGCIALGSSIVDLDKDNYLDVTNSRTTIDLFHKVLDGFKEATLIIE